MLTVQCANGNSLDLSVGAFTAIASEADGMVPITWTWN
jgi:expansin (peptidoglycan-binding protein)